MTLFVICCSALVVAGGTTALAVHDQCDYPRIADRTAARHCRKAAVDFVFS